MNQKYPAKQSHIAKQKICADQKLSGLPAKPARARTILSAALVFSAALLLSSCDYWFEEWYKNGEASESPQTAEAATGNVLSHYCNYPTPTDGGCTGEGWSWVFDDSGKLAAQKRVSVYTDAAAASADYKAWLEPKRSDYDSDEDYEEDKKDYEAWLEADGKAWVSGNKLYAEWKISRWYSVDSRDDFLEINGVYFICKYTTDRDGGRVGVGYKKKDGSPGMTGRWWEAFEDGGYGTEYYDINADGTFVRHWSNNSEDITGTWAAVEVDAIQKFFKDNEGDVIESGFYSGYSAPVTFIKANTTAGPFYLSCYYNGVMYSHFGGEPYIPKPLP